MNKLLLVFIVFIFVVRFGGAVLYEISKKIGGGK